MASTSFQYVLAHPVVASVIPGIGSASELEENAAKGVVKTPADQWAELRQVELIPEDATPRNPIDKIIKPIHVSH